MGTTLPSLAEPSREHSHLITGAPATTPGHHSAPDMHVLMCRRLFLARPGLRRVSFREVSGRVAAMPSPSNQDAAPTLSDLLAR